MNVETAFIYRRGLEKSDFMRDTFTLELKTTLNIAPINGLKSQSNCYSYPALLGSQILTDPSFSQKLAQSEDKLSDIRDVIRSKD